MKENSSPAEFRTNFRPGMEILLCSGRAQIDPAAKARVCAIVGDGLNWDEAAANAAAHRMSPVLYECLAALEKERVPLSANLRILDDAFRESAANAFMLARELLQLYGLFDAARVPVIPYKGPVLAMLAYGNIAKRSYVDLDFALPQRYIPQASEVMQAAGYRPAFDPQEAHSGENPFAPGQYSFQGAGQTFPVELHTERTLRYFPSPLNFTDLTSRLIRVEIAGQSLRTFSVEDTVVILCVHGAKHFWDRLAWVFDVAKLITAQKVDWVLLQQIAAEVKSTRVTLLGLYLAHDLFGAFLPDSILEKIRRDPNVLELAKRVLGPYTGICDPGAGVWSRAQFRLRSRDELGQGLRHTLRLALNPTESDRRVVRLPRLLAGLYVLIRPWRLLREYGWGAKRLR